jgi:hypothetical protein
MKGAAAGSAPVESMELEFLQVGQLSVVGVNMEESGAAATAVAKSVMKSFMVVDGMEWAGWKELMS